MNLDISDIVARYGAEVARLTQRAVLAEARADAAERELETMKKEQNNGS